MHYVCILCSTALFFAMYIDHVFFSFLPFSYACKRYSYVLYIYDISGPIIPTWNRIHACPCPCCMSMSKLREHVHSVCPCPFCRGTRTAATQLHMSGGFHIRALFTGIDGHIVDDRWISTDTIDWYYWSCWPPIVLIHHLRIFSLWSIVSIIDHKILIRTITIDP